MGKKKTLREVLLRHPDLFDLVQALAKEDSLVAEENDDDGLVKVVLTREGKKKKKEFHFTRTADGYLFRCQTDPAEPARDA